MYENPIKLNKQTETANKQKQNKAKTYDQSFTNTISISRQSQQLITIQIALRHQS